MSNTPSIGGRIRAAAWLVVLMVCTSVPALAACDINGAWEGAYNDDGGNTGTLTATFANASSTTVNISVIVILSGYGTLSETPTATLNGSTLTWSYSVPGTGTQSGNGTIASDCNHLSGTVVTTLDQFGFPVTGTYTLSRQPVALSVWGLTFPQTPIAGNGSAAQSVSITNTGTTSLALGPVTNDGDFTSTSACSTALAPGGSCSVSVTCNPTGPGIRSGSLYINDTNKTPIGSVALSCSGVQPLTGANFLPVSGWWWDPKLNGTAFFVEYGGNSGRGLFVGGFLYDAGGNSTWLVSTGPLSSASYSSQWIKVSGGQTLTGPYKTPSQGNAGNIGVQFVDANNAAMTRPDGSKINLVRFSFSNGSTPAPPVGGAPQSGWWWAGSALSGTGYGIEIQGNAVFIVAYVYDNSGNPIWYLATGTLTSPTSYVGSWQNYAGGPQLSSPEGNYTVHTINGSDVAMSLTFSDATHGKLTMGSVTVPIVRFQEF